MSNDKVRAEFEEWYLSEIDNEAPVLAGGIFSSQHGNWCWQAWQSSRAALVVELPRLQGDAQYDGQEVIDALDAAGVAYK